MSCWSASAPHIRSGESIPKIMWSVVIALAPAAAFSVYLFGMPALILIGRDRGLGGRCRGADTAAAAEAGDGPGRVRGHHRAPPGHERAARRAPGGWSPIGSAFAMIIVKQLFGGLGFNIFNPALAARAFLMASWPVHMTTALAPLFRRA